MPSPRILAMQNSLSLSILILFVLCSAPGIIIVVGLSDSKFTTAEKSIDESLAGLILRHSLRNVASVPNNGNPNEQNIENAKDMNSGGNQRNLEKPYNVYSGDLIALNWSETIPNVSDFFQLTTICPTNKTSRAECSCEVIHSSGEKCVRCLVCGVSMYYYIDCRNIFPFDHPCLAVDCFGNCFIHQEPTSETNKRRTTIIMLVMTLFGFLGASPCCIALFWPNEDTGSTRWGGRVGTNPSVSPMDPEIRQRIIDSCLSTRTLCSSDTLVCKDSNDFDKRTTKDELSQHGIELSIQKIVLEETSHDPCQICLDPFQEGNKVSSSLISECNHEFHHDCIAEWLKLHETCPTCRDKFISKDEISNSQP